MVIEIAYAQEDGYLHAATSGEWTAEGIARAAVQVADEARRRGATRILLDVTGLTEPESDFHRFIVGEEIARVFEGVKVAVVAKGFAINNTTEEAAVARGADIRVVAEYTAAVEWLMGPTDDWLPAFSRS